MFNEKSILITGGTGSFGNAFVERILRDYSPRRIAVYSRDELKQYEMQQKFEDKRMRFFIGDVRDAARLATAMIDVDYVVHAAALKQVPAAEYNPMECIKTNVLGGQNVIDAAIACGVKSVVALSSDKAANPINLYGATKLCADKLFTAANNMVGKKKTSFSVVRYGNVLQSRGSVIPLFKKLLAEGAKVLPITDPNMTRFWISLPQGVDFVIKAFYRMQGGELFVPKIPSARIVDIAEAMAPGMPLDIIGIRPGEKLHEIMCPADDAHHTLEFKDHFVITPAITFRSLEYDVNSLDEQGGPVDPSFEYNSGNNPWFLTVDELRKICS